MNHLYKVQNNLALSHNLPSTWNNKCITDKLCFPSIALLRTQFFSVLNSLVIQIGSNSSNRQRSDSAESRHNIFHHATPTIESQAQPFIQPSPQLQSVQQSDTGRNKYANRSKAIDRIAATSSTTRTTGLQRKDQL